MASCFDLRWLRWRSPSALTTGGGACPPWGKLTHETNTGLRFFGGCDVGRCGDCSILLCDDDASEGVPLAAADERVARGVGVWGLGVWGFCGELRSERPLSVDTGREGPMGGVVPVGLEVAAMAGRVFGKVIMVFVHNEAPILLLG